MLSKLKNCPDCGSENKNVDRDKGEASCRECGCVMEDKAIDLGKDWLDSDDNAPERRTGPPLTDTKYDRGLGTNIGNKNDIYKLNYKDQRRFFRIRTQHNRTANAMERNLKLAFDELERLSSHLKLPKFVEEDTAKIYREAVAKGLSRGRSIETLMSGAVYAACRIHEIPRSLYDVSQASGIEKRNVSKAYRLLNRELDIKIKPSKAENHIPRLASVLNLNIKTQMKAVEIVEKTRNIESFSGRTPVGLAAAALYVSALRNRERRTQRDVADASGVTEVTIRNSYKALVRGLDLDAKIKKSGKKKIYQKW